MTRSEFLTSCISTAITGAFPVCGMSIDDKFDLVKNELYTNISSLMRYYAYEHNTEKVRKELEIKVLDCLYAFVKKHDLPLYENFVRCDETNNTQDSIDKNEMHLDLGIRLTSEHQLKTISWCTNFNGLFEKEEQ